MQQLKSHLKSSCTAVSLTFKRNTVLLACAALFAGAWMVTHRLSDSYYGDNPKTLEGWHVQQQPGVPALGGNARFISSSAAEVPAPTAAASKAAPKLLGPTTDAPMKVQPPFEPTCLATDLMKMETWGCPVILCNKDPSCTVQDPTCCSYLNFQMLSFLHDFLASKCLETEYLAMFGTGLGAVRNNTIIPWTEDVDVGITPLALQFLELNSTREELWRHGYSLWHHLSQTAIPYPGYWKMCPHRHHPSPHFQAAMQPEGYVWQSGPQGTWRQMGAYTDLWPMYPVPQSTKDCRARMGINTTEMLATPWDDLVKPGLQVQINPCRYRQKPDDDDESQRQQRFCIMYATEPFDVSTTPRQVAIEDRMFPTATDQERILPTVYGPGWLTPDPPNHGTWPSIPDGFAVAQAVVEKLSLGAWGGMPYKERKRRCKNRLKGKWLGL